MDRFTITPKRFRTLAIVTGASWELGHAYMDYFFTKGCRVVGVSNKPPSRPVKGRKTKYFVMDLLNLNATARMVESLSLSSYEKIIWVHAVGKFKFEPKGLPEIDHDQDGIDDEVFHGSYGTFQSLYETMSTHLPSRIHSFTFGLLGSVSTDYSPFHYSSYTKTMEQLSAYAQIELARDARRVTNGVYIKISSLKVNNPSREFDKKSQYLLEPAEVVARSAPYLEHPTSPWRELRILKPDPDFDISWYTNPSRVEERWKE